MIRIILLIIIGISLSNVDIRAAKFIVEGSSADTTMFFNDSDQAGTKVVVKGIILTIGTREFSTEKERELGSNIQERSKVSVRLLDDDGIIPGGILYVINERNIVVAKMSVLETYKTASFGKICVGYGNFRAVKKDFKVVMKFSDNHQSDAYLYIARAYREIEKNERAKAMQYFEKALDADAGNPEAHAGLGYLYYEQKLIPFSIREFDAAYKSRGRVYDREDRFMILIGCVQSRFSAVFNSELPKGNKTREKYLNEGIKFAKEAVQINDDSVEAHLMLGKFYYDRSTDAMTKIETENDVLTEKEMLKVLELRNDNIEACIVLAKIYKKHDRRDKAGDYISRARSIDPANRDAMDLEKAIKNMK